jgi:3-dehydroquinate dehydratase/shikimate dehydrogenase
MNDRLDGPLIVGSVQESDADTTRAKAARLPSGCGLVEIRGDELSAAELAGVVRGIDRPTIATVRRRDEGGRFDGSEADRRHMLEQALDAGARFVDVEWGSDLADWAGSGLGSRIILSHHGAPCVLESLVELHGKMAATGAARLKIVPRAQSVGEIGAVRELLLRYADTERRLTCFAIGRAGALTRLLAPSWGSWATYGAVLPGAETAEGQFTVDDMLRVYDVLKIDTRTERFVLIGERVFSSPSPAMHHAGYAAAGIDARYFPLELDRLDVLPELVAPDGSLCAAGLAVTIPFKERVAERCRLDDPIAQASGAVNTVRIEANGWAGYNTDGPAAVERVGSHLDPRGRRIAVVGAGGTARAVAASFRGAGASVTLFNRDVQRAEQAGRSLGVAWGGLAELKSAGWDVLINATPVGRAGEQLVPSRCLTGGVVLDAVYGPRPTPLVAAARAGGLAVVDGLELLAAQAVLQFRRMTGRQAKFSELRTAGEAWLAPRSRT